MKKRLVCGWGENDSPVGYIVHHCPFYRKWHDMLGRRLNLKDVTVCEEWKSFWTFKEWAETKTKDWEGEYLDKDLRIPGNKGYTPDACLIVTNRINTLQLRIDPEKPIGDNPYPLGVVLCKREKGPDKYGSQIVIDGESTWLGTFLTVAAASSDYCKAKAKDVRVLADSPDADCPITKASLLRWAEHYEGVAYLRDNKR